MVEVPAELLDGWQWVMQSGEGAFIVISNVRFRKRSIVALQQVARPMEGFLELFEAGEVVWFRVTQDSSWAQIAAASSPARYRGARLSKEMPPLSTTPAPSSSSSSVNSTSTSTSTSTATSSTSSTSSSASTSAASASVSSGMCRVSVTCDSVACVEDNLHVASLSLASPLLNLVEVDGKSCVAVQVNEVHNLEHYLGHRLLLRDLLVRQEGDRLGLCADLFTDILIAD